MYVESSRRGWLGVRRGCCNEDGRRGGRGMVAVTDAGVQLGAPSDELAGAERTQGFTQRGIRADQHRFELVDRLTPSLDGSQVHHIASGHARLKTLRTHGDLARERVAMII